MNKIKDPNNIWTTFAGLTREDFTCTAWRRRSCEGADDVNMFADDTPLRILNKDSCCFDVYSIIYLKFRAGRSYRIEEFNDNVRSSDLPTSTILYLILLFWLLLMLCKFKNLKIAVEFYVWRAFSGLKIEQSL